MHWSTEGAVVAAHSKMGAEAEEGRLSMVEEGVEELQLLAPLARDGKPKGAVVEVRAARCSSVAAGEVVEPLHSLGATVVVARQKLAEYLAMAVEEGLAREPEEVVDRTVPGFL